MPCQFMTIMVVFSMLAFHSTALVTKHDTTGTDQRQMIYTNRGDCWKKVKANGRIRSPTFMQQEDPESKKVLKDGYYYMDCVEDYLLAFGDKFGDNKYSYKYDAVANKSIVRYTGDEPMTPNVCFNFCRTEEGMSFFGITNGRDCYCTPYLKSMASDNSRCSTPCEGSKGLFCGSKTKSSIYEMHQCNDIAKQLGLITVKAHTDWTNLAELVQKCNKAAKSELELATNFQKQFGAVGDVATSNLMQVAKAAASDLLNLATKAEEELNFMDPAIKTAAKLLNLDLEKFDEVTAKDDDEENEPVDLEAIIAPLMDEGASDFSSSAVVQKADKLSAILTKMVPEVEEMQEKLQDMYLYVEPYINFAFDIKHGACTTDDNGCINSPYYPAGEFRYSWWRWYRDYAGYGNNEKCEIEVLPKEADIKVEKFKSGYLHDALELNGAFFSGWNAKVQCPWWFTHSRWASWYRKYYKNMYNGKDCGKSIFDVKKVSGTIHWSANWWYRTDGWKICDVTPKVKDDVQYGLQYYPAMYFVDKAYKDMPMTCSGTIIGKPIHYRNFHFCSKACDAKVGECVGFAYYPTTPNKPNFCFLYSAFTSGTYYTGCNLGLIQKQNKTSVDQPLEGEPTHAVCVAKLSKFVGTTIKFKELKKADRCWK